MKVSILIPCFNAGRWVAAAIESALAQTWPDTEVIVVDDGSTDDSVDVIRRFAGQIRWERVPHGGANPARNRLLALATGEWVQYLDADDYLLAGKIAGQMPCVEAAPECDVVFGPVALEQDGKRTMTPIPEPHDPWILLARWYLPQTGGPLWRRQAIAEVGGWKPDQPCCQEHELYLRLLSAGKRFTYCAEGGAIYREWGSDTVSRRNRAEVRVRRQEILARAESTLRERGELSAARLDAINITRFADARIAWQEDPREARAIVETIHASQPGFLPKGVAAPPRYVWTYRLFGFAASERIADWLRGSLPA